MPNQIHIRKGTEHNPTPCLQVPAIKETIAQEKNLTLVRKLAALRSVYSVSHKSGMGDRRATVHPIVKTVYLVRTKV